MADDNAEMSCLVAGGAAVRESDATNSASIMQKKGFINKSVVLLAAMALGSCALAGLVAHGKTVQPRTSTGTNVEDVTKLFWGIKLPHCKPDLEEDGNVYYKAHSCIVGSRWWHSCKSEGMETNPEFHRLCSCTSGYVFVRGHIWKSMAQHGKHGAKDGGEVSENGALAGGVAGAINGAVKQQSSGMCVASSKLKPDLYNRIIK